MKIPESIIEKYQLEPADSHIGQALYYNLQCFKSSLPGFEGILFMECDFHGKPSKYIQFYNKTAKRDGSLTPEFLEDSPIDRVLKLCQ
jgi:hypothetical protein